ncbi:hypothetical protein [Methylobacterium sp. Leaf123]|uniref:hypothetical protein n=1 Tax=Methylobacterium sp. Leaf123 TaxID=1736264 RepID=UPI000B205CFF|nr:hypothetical protein [Methylobacterium sp. Leaf123]
MTAKTEAPDLARSDLLQRPPHGRVVGSTTMPPIVTPTFVSRTDATPERRRLRRQSRLAGGRASGPAPERAGLGG